MAGYSDKSLIAKLGYTSGDTILVSGAPEWFLAELRRNGIQPVTNFPAVWAHIFVTSQAELNQYLREDSLEQIQKALWLSWPKQTAKVATDLTEKALRDFVLLIGWVDIKVAAIDQTWSGLKFTRRKT